MGTIIRNRTLVSDSWSRPEIAVDGGPSTAQVAGDVIVTLPTWRAAREQLLARAGRNGVEVNGDEEPESLLPDLAHFSLVAVRFPKFSDGRGCTLGYLLRTRYGFLGELRATGDIFRDQLRALEDCGFDAYELRAGEDPVAALASFTAISTAYQGTAREPRPLFRRREEHVGR